MADGRNGSLAYHCSLALWDSITAAPQVTLFVKGDFELIVRENAVISAVYALREKIPTVLAWRQFRRLGRGGLREGEEGVGVGTRGGGVDDLLDGGLSVRD